MIRYWAGGDHEERDVPEGFNPMLYSSERKRPSIHLPRWASRLTLEIAGVRVERVQDISDSDAIAEGVERSHVNYSAVAGSLVNGSIHCDRYARLWDSLNGPASWSKNPWVWVLDFTVAERTP